MKDMKENKYQYIRILKYLFIGLSLSIGFAFSSVRLTKPHQISQLLTEQIFKEHTYEFSCTKVVQGAFDRSEKGLAVLLLEELNEELVISEDYLPENSHEGDWYFICLSSQGIKVLKAEKLSSVQKEQSQKLLKQLQKRKSSSFR